MLAAIGAPSSARAVQGAGDWWHPGRSGRIALGPKNVIAEFGEIHPKVLEALDLDGPAVGFTLFLDAVPMPRAKGTARPALMLEPLQPVERDFAFVVGRRVAAQDVAAAAAAADKMVTDARVFDAFEGEAVAAGEKSLAVSVRIQPHGRTLTDEEIAAISDRIVAKVTKATDGRLRG